MSRRRYAAVGTGARAVAFLDSIAGRFRESAELVGLCDSSAVRRAYHQRRLDSQYGIGLVPAYGDFDLMLAETRPDTVIVCTPDRFHADYIVRSLDFGADVISEKPLAVDAGQYHEIETAVARTGRRVRTAFNYRWSPGVSAVRERIARGDIGRVRHVDFEYLLNTSHGADYFRRWHSEKAHSGGLLVHKSTHHFDLINWWIDGIPELVFALGGLVFYGKKNALERGQEAWTRYARYADAPAASDDPFRLSLEGDPALDGLYRQAEKESGYIRDRNVLRDGIDIEDSMSVLVRYRTGAMVTYSLNAFSPQEGFRASICGDGGRIEYQEWHRPHLITGGKEMGASAQGHRMRLTLQKLFSPAEEIPIIQAEGSHGGADPLLQEHLFAAVPPTDPLRRGAGHEQGAASFLIGAAANRSIVTGQPVRIGDLAALRPDALRLSELL